MIAPVALFVFNRPGLTRAAMSRLAALRPARLLVVADGPRSDVDTALCRETLDAVYAGLTWDVEVDVVTSEVNLGCRRRVESGLDWVFSLVDRAIVLEDDIEVTPAFAESASRGLDRLGGRPEVRMISGHNPLVEWPQDPAPFLARAGSIWGWATWADRWHAYRAGFAAIESDGTDEVRAALRSGIARHASSDLHRRLQTHLWDTAMWRRIDTWDMPWSLWTLATGGLCCVVAHNQVANHGMGPEAVHTTALDDVRGQLPLVPWVPRTDDFDGMTVVERFAHLATLLELVLNYDEPRRWKVLASRRDRLPAKASGAGWDVMLAPFDHSEETSDVIAHLARWIDSSHLAGLAEIFPVDTTDSSAARGAPDGAPC